MGKRAKETLERGYKSRISKLVEELRGVRKKSKKQLRLRTVIQSQKEKMGDLSSEIRNIKGQKKNLSRQIKHEHDRFRRWQIKRQNEILKIKRKTL